MPLTTYGDELVTCRDCAFWEEDEPDGRGVMRGFCRVRPPSMNGAGRGVWPLTTFADYCGEGRIWMTDEEG